MSPEQGNVGIPKADALTTLERFVVDNDDFLALETRMGRYVNF
jgi:hypothetical protein